MLSAGLNEITRKFMKNMVFTYYTSSNFQSDIPGCNQTRAACINVLKTSHQGFFFIKNYLRRK